MFGPSDSEASHSGSDASRLNDWELEPKGFSLAVVRGLRLKFIELGTTVTVTARNLNNASSLSLCSESDIWNLALYDIIVFL